MTKISHRRGLMMQTVELEITKKGRKYFKGNYPGKTCVYDIVINDISKDFEIGKTYTFLAKEEKETSRFGVKITYTPEKIQNSELTKEERIKEAKEVQKNEYEIKNAISRVENYLGYIKENLTQYWYAKGESTVLECIEILKNNGLDVSEYQNKLVALKNEFEEKSELNKSKENEPNKYEIQNAIRKTELFLGYIKENLDKYWYKKGEEVVLEYIEFLKNTNIDTTEYENKLEDLKVQFEEIKKEIEKQKEEERKKEAMYKTFTSQFDVYTKNEIIINDNKAYKIIKVIKEYLEQDGFSFGLMEEEGWMYTAKCIEITGTEEGQRAIVEHIENEKKKQLKKQIIKNYNELIEKARELGTMKFEDEPAGIVIENTADIYGTGRKILKDGNIFWILINNGMDGDNWSRNNYRSYMAYKYELTKEDEEVIYNFMNK